MGVFLMFSKYPPPLNSKNAMRHCVLALSPFPIHQIQETPPQGCVSRVWHSYHPSPLSEHEQCIERAVRVHFLHSGAPEHEKCTTIGTFMFTPLPSNTLVSPLYLVSPSLPLPCLSLPCLSFSLVPFCFFTLYFS